MSLKLFSKIVEIFRPSRQDDFQTEVDEETLRVARYLGHFDVDKVQLKRSPLGGWVCTFDDEDPTETDNEDSDDEENNVIKESASIKIAPQIRDSPKKELIRSFSFLSSRMKMKFRNGGS